MIIVDKGKVIVPMGAKIPEHLECLFKTTPLGRVATVKAPFLAYAIANEILVDTGQMFEDKEAERIIDMFRHDDAAWPTNPNVLTHAYRYVYGRQALITDAAELMYKIAMMLR